MEEKEKERQDRERDRVFKLEIARLGLEAERKKQVFDVTKVAKFVPPFNEEVPKNSFSNLNMLVSHLNGPKDVGHCWFNLYLQEKVVLYTLA